MELKFDNEDPSADSEVKFGSAINHDNIYAPTLVYFRPQGLCNCYSSGIGSYFPMILVFIYFVYLIIRYAVSTLWNNNILIIVVL
jgi:hypothetical protein